MDAFRKSNVILRGARIRQRENYDYYEENRCSSYIVHTAESIHLLCAQKDFESSQSIVPIDWNMDRLDGTPIMHHSD